MVIDRLPETARQESPGNMFADDINICERSREQSEAKLAALEKRGLRISKSKTEHLRLNADTNGTTIKVKSSDFAKVKEFKYLGATL